MSGNILMDSVILFLLVYALLDIFTQIASFLSRMVMGRPRIMDGNCVLFLHTGTDDLEQQVRKAVKNAENSCCSLLLVDVGLSGEEKRIAERLCAEYEFLYLYQKEQYIRYVENMA